MFGSHVPAEQGGNELAPRIWRGADIRHQVEQLLDADTDRRTVALMNPDLGIGSGVSPGVDVSINVLRTGERTNPHRHTSSVISYVQHGHGFSVIGGRRIDWGPGDVFTTPAWMPHFHAAAEDSEPVVRLGFSDAALLRRLGILIHDVGDPEETPEPPPTVPWDPDVGARVEGSDGRFLGYREILKPAWRPTAAQRWPADAIRRWLAPMDNGDPEFRGRRLGLLYDPATGQAQGTVAGMQLIAGIIAVGEVQPSHRHTSVSVNYWTAGKGFSSGRGHRVDWEAGDLQLTPAWAPHTNVNDGDETARTFILQDAPMLYNLGALLWQEVLDAPIARMGSDEVELPRIEPVHS